MEQKPISVDVETARKLKAISETSRISQTEILRDFVNACYTVLESTKADRVSMGSLPNLKRKCVETPIIPLLVGKLAPTENSVSDSEVDEKIRTEIEKKREKK